MPTFEGQPQALEAPAGQPQASARLARALERPSHAYLFVGPAHTGKRTAARLFAQAMLCERGTGCGECDSCRAVVGDRHPDLRIWDVPEGEKTFKVEQVRELITAVSRKPFQGSRAVHVLAAVDAMAPAGANALLKTLEEPPPAALLILLARDLDAILPTIVSRCQVVPFGLTAPEVIEKALRARFPASDALRLAAQRSEGRMGRAIELAGGEAPPDPPVELPVGPGVGAIAWTDRLAAMNGADQQAHLAALIAWLRDAAWLSAGGTEDRLLRPQDANWLVAAAPTRPPEDWVTLAEAAEAARDRLERHGNARLVLDELARTLVGSA